MTDRYDSTPDPKFLRAMQNQKWNVAGALSELVDNSLGASRGNATRVQIIHDPKARTLAVLDNGRGMTHIGELFGLGKGLGLTPGDIGLYGSGGTMAVLWLAHKVTVASLRDGLVCRDTVDWTDVIRRGYWPQISDDWKEASPRNTPAQLYNAGHGTIILLHLADKRKFQPSNARRDLARTYAPGLRKGREIIWTTVGTKDAGTDALPDVTPTFDKPEDAVEFDISLQVDDELLPVHGVVGFKEGLSQSASRVAIGFQHRVITSTRDCYVSPDREEAYLGAGITGWLDLGDGWQPYLTTTKDGIDDDRLWDALMGYVFNEIRDILQRVERQDLKVELESIGLNLKNAFDSLRHARVTTGIEDPNGQETRGSDGSGGAGEQPGTREKHLVTIGDGEKFREEAEAPITEIRIEPQTDQEIEGQLIKAEVIASQLVVFVNEDADCIKEALKQEPVNKMMLHLGITREIAAELVADPMFDRLLPSALRSTSETDAAKRARLLHKHLMQRVREVEAAA